MENVVSVIYHGDLPRWKKYEEFTSPDGMLRVNFTQESSGKFIAHNVPEAIALLMARSAAYDIIDKDGKVPEKYKHLVAPPAPPAPPSARAGNSDSAELKDLRETLVEAELALTESETELQEVKQKLVDAQRQIAVQEKRIAELQQQLGTKMTPTAAKK